MSTRRKRHGGKKQRTWEDLNKSIGHNGLMESETWYLARQASLADDVDTAETVLVDHFGALTTAKHSLDAMDEEVAKRFEVVARVVFEKEAPPG